MLNGYTDVPEEVVMNNGGVVGGSLPRFSSVLVTRVARKGLLETARCLAFRALGFSLMGAKTR